MEEKRIIEIDGVKIEVDMRTAKRIDTFKVGDNVKVLCKSGDDFKVRPGVIIDFCNFKEKPTISAGRRHPLFLQRGAASAASTSAGSKKFMLSRIFSLSMV